MVGAASNGVFKRFTVGSVANGLLHASPVPVALAPRGYNRRDPLTRLTVMTGMREGWQAVLDVGITAAGGGTSRCAWFPWWRSTSWNRPTLT